jgi:hypothetical protein
VVEQAEAVSGGVPVGEGFTVPFGEAEAAFVLGDEAELGGEGGELRREHLVVHQEAMAKNYGRAAAATVFEVDALAVNV